MESNELLHQLADALRERLRVIADHAGRDRNPAEHLARLQAVSEKVDSLQAQLPHDADPRLAHFVQRRSYDKALEFIETQRAG
jgi:plasmid stabilization system protein ParE